MSDCSTQAMMPKERRTCGTCEHVNDVRLGCMFAANDSSYYMRSTKPDVRACEHYVDDLDSLPRRYERLARVARELNDCLYKALMGARPDGQAPDGLIDWAARLDGELIELGVIVDD